jgi:hypothetical protein
MTKVTTGKSHEIVALAKPYIRRQNPVSTQHSYRAVALEFVLAHSKYLTLFAKYLLKSPLRNIKLVFGINVPVASQAPDDTVANTRVDTLSLLVLSISGLFLTSNSTFFLLGSGPYSELINLGVLCT